MAAIYEEIVLKTHNIVDLIFRLEELTMKNVILKTVGAALLSAYASMSMAITVGGVTWDENFLLDFEMKAGDLRESFVTQIGDTLYGYGIVSFINGSNSFCACDLTYTFTYTVKDIAPNEIMFEGGQVDFYAQAAGSYNTLDASSAVGTAAELWLSLTGHEDTWATTAVNPVGTLFGTFTGSLGGSEDGSGQGLLDVAGGVAAPYLDTNMEADGSDLSLSSSFQPLNDLQNCPATGDIAFCLSGTAELFGVSQTIPAPATLLLFGLGLLSLVGVRARKA